MTDEPRKPFWVKCEPCGHCWPAAYLPMDVSQFVKATRRLACPKCAASGKAILIAKQSEGVLREPQPEPAP